MISPAPREEVTRVLVDWSGGDREAPAKLMPLVYEELRQLARQYLQRERPDHTLQATGLVHEAYLRLVDQSTTSWQNRAHFFGVAAQLMRRILVDSARRKRSLKRGAAAVREEIQEDHWVQDVRSDELLAVDEALDLLAREDPVSAELVKLRYFVGMNMDEAAAALDLPLRTTERMWTFARAWLRSAISGKADSRRI